MPTPLFRRVKRNNRQLIIIVIILLLYYYIDNNILIVDIDENSVNILILDSNLKIYHYLI
jgi:hypothetical protein